MSVRVRNFTVKIDGKENNAVLKKFKDVDGYNYLNSFENGYYPLTAGRSLITDEEIIRKIAKKHPTSEIFFRIDTDYGEEAYLYKGGEIKKLKKEWK